MAEAHIYWVKKGNCGLSTGKIVTPVVYNSKIWAFEEWSPGPNSLASSSDGTTWTTVNSSLPFSTVLWGGYESLEGVWANGLFVTGGFGGMAQVWSSTDGVTWNHLADAPWTGRAGHCVTKYAYDSWGSHYEYMFILGGAAGGSVYLNDQWHTVDGTTWYNPTSTTSYSGRWHATATCFVPTTGPYAGQPILWLMGGRNSSATFNDVWNCIPWPWPSYPYSWDWVRVTEHAPWNFSSQTISSLALVDKLWIFGVGVTSGNWESWYTYDGVNWQEANTSPLPGGFRISKTVSFDSKIWAIDGNRDVWAGEVDLLSSSSSVSSPSTLTSVSSLSSLTSTSVSSSSLSSTSTEIKTTTSSQSSSTYLQTTSSSSIMERKPKLCSIDLSNYSANIKDMDLSF